MCIRDSRKGMRIVVDIRKDANAQVILNQLYQYTQLQDTVGVILLAIDHKAVSYTHLDVYKRQERDMKNDQHLRETVSDIIKNVKA